MKRLFEQILFVAASLLLIKLSYQLVMSIAQAKNILWGQSFILAFLINLYITGVFAFAGFALPTQRLMPSFYYSIKNSKRLKKWFKRLKVEWFRAFLLATFWKKQSQRDKYFDGTLSGIENLERQSKKSEFGHLMPLIVITGVSVYVLTLGFYILAFFAMLWNVLGNFYPIMLQRHHRMRIDVIRRRMKRKNQKKQTS